jgi:hypothetical protein
VVELSKLRSLEVGQEVRIVEPLSRLCKYPSISSKRSSTPSHQRVFRNLVYSNFNPY